MVEKVLTAWSHVGERREARLIVARTEFRPSKLALRKLNLPRGVQSGDLRVKLESTMMALRGNVRMSMRRLRKNPHEGLRR